MWRIITRFDSYIAVSDLFHHYCGRHGRATGRILRALRNLPRSSAHAQSPPLLLPVARLHHSPGGTARHAILVLSGGSTSPMLGYLSFFVGTE